MQPIEFEANHSVMTSSGRARRLVAIGSLGWFLGLSVAMTACEKGTDPVTEAGGSGSGGETSTASGGGDEGGANAAAAYAEGPDACVQLDKWKGVIKTANPNVSKGKTVTCSLGVDVCKPTYLVDGSYHTDSITMLAAGTTDSSTWEEGWAAVNVGSGHTKLLLTWQDVGWTEFNAPSSGPLDYVIETSSDTTDGSDGTWTAVAEVTDNAIRGRSHVFDFDGQSWVRFRVTKAPSLSSGNGYTTVYLDELALFDISDSTEGTRDSVLFMGDSITRMSLGFSKARTTDVDTLITESASAFTPALLDSGIGGENTAQGAAHATDWLNADPTLDTFAGLDFVTVAYGTNDAWGNNSPVAKKYEENLRSIIETVIEAGKTPILTRIPYDTVATGVLTAYNQIVQDLTEEYELPCGPDLYTYFAQHQDELSAEDGVHPTSAGQESIRRLYAEALLPLYATE